MARNLNNATSVMRSLIEKDIRTMEPSRVEDHRNGFASIISGKIDMISEKQTREMSFQNNLDIDGSTTISGCLEITDECGDFSRFASTVLNNAICLEKESSIGQHSSDRLLGTSSQLENITIENMSATHGKFPATERSLDHPLCSNQGSDANSLYAISDKIDFVKKVKSNIGEIRVVLCTSCTSCTRTKTSKKASLVKKRKPKTRCVDNKKPLEIDNEVHVPPVRP